jgi:hypothetical protein
VVAEGWVAVVVRLLSAEVVVMVLLAGLILGAVMGLKAGVEKVVVEEVRSPHCQCMTAHHRYNKHVTETC